MKIGSKRRLIVMSYQRTEAFCEDLFDEVEYFPHNEQDPDSNTVVLFEGGTDINSGLYGEFRGQHTQKPNDVRDNNELSMFYKARKGHARMLGICRGAQLLCALSGGSLVQHVNGHHAGHQIKTFDHQIVTDRSEHHQMMYPWCVVDPRTYRILAWALPRRSKLYRDGWDNDCGAALTNVEPEAIWFEESQSLALQGHPEWVLRDHKVIYEDPYVAWCREQVKNFLLLEDIPDGL